MTTSRQIDVQVDHHPSGNLTLKERDVGQAMWSDVKGEHLGANPNVAQFYQQVAKRLARHAKNGVIVVSYKDTGPKLARNS